MDKDISRNLLDDHNIILYGLFMLGIITPDMRGEIISAIIAFWTRNKIK
jgi:uncharacterized membrane protein